MQQRWIDCSVPASQCHSRHRCCRQPGPWHVMLRGLDRQWVKRKRRWQMPACKGSSICEQRLRVSPTVASVADVGELGLCMYMKNVLNIRHKASLTRHQQRGGRKKKEVGETKRTRCKGVVSLRVCRKACEKVPSMSDGIHPPSEASHSQSRRSHQETAQKENTTYPVCTRSIRADALRHASAICSIDHQT